MFRAVGPCSAGARRTQGCWLAGGVLPRPDLPVSRGLLVRVLSLCMLGLLTRAGGGEGPGNVAAKVQSRGAGKELLGLLAPGHPWEPHPSPDQREGCVPPRTPNPPRRGRVSVGRTCVARGPWLRGAGTLGAEGVGCECHPASREDRRAQLLLLLRRHRQALPLSLMLFYFT